MACRPPPPPLWVDPIDADPLKADPPRCTPPLDAGHVTCDACREGNQPPRPQLADKHL